MILGVRWRGKFAWKFAVDPSPPTVHNHRSSSRNPPQMGHGLQLKAQRGFFLRKIHFVVVLPNASSTRFQ